MVDLAWAQDSPGGFKLQVGRAAPQETEGQWVASGAREVRERRRTFNGAQTHLLVPHMLCSIPVQARLEVCRRRVVP